MAEEQKKKVWRASVELLGTPKGKARPRFTKSGRTYTPHTTAEYEKHIASEWHHQNPGWRPLEGAVQVRIFAYFAIPKNASKKKRQELDGAPCTKKPDADNIAKAVLDGLNGTAYTDDAQVTDVLVLKRWDRTSRTLVTVAEIETEA